MISSYGKSGIDKEDDKRKENTRRSKLAKFIDRTDGEVCCDFVAKI